MTAGPAGGLARGGSARNEFLSWDDYFMLLAELSAQRSKDPNRQVGACIVDGDKHVMGIGYNGFPTGCHDAQLPWSGKEKLGDAARDDSSDSWLDTKYPYVCHAEANAILNCHSRQLKGCTIYVTLFPCNECAKLIIQSGIKRVMYVSDKNHAQPKWVASRKLLDMAAVAYEKLEPTHQRIMLSLNARERSVLGDATTSSSTTSSTPANAAARSGATAPCCADDIPAPTVATQQRTLATASSPPPVLAFAAGLAAGVGLCLLAVRRGPRS